MHAVKHDYDLFGVMCLACINGLAGGIIRDILLSADSVYCLQHWELILTCIGIAIPVMFFCHMLDKFDLPMDIINTFSVALWALIGASNAYGTGLSLLPCAILGTVSAVGGGCLRDMLLNRPPRIFISGTVYSSAIFIGAFLYVGALMVGYSTLMSASIGISTILTMRLFSLFLHIETKPVRDYTLKMEVTINNLTAKLKNRQNKHKETKIMGRGSI